MAIIEPDFPKSPFTSVEEPLEQKNFLDEAVKDGVSIVLWTKKQEFLLEKLKFISFEPASGFELETATTPDVTLLLEHLKRTEEPCYFTFGLWRCGVFFTAILEKELPGASKTLLRFKPPKDFYKVQRRNTLRLPIKPPYLLLAEIRIPGVPTQNQRKITDISIGGLAILTSPSEVEYFQKGRVLGEVRITIRNRQIISAAEVRHTRLINKETFPQLLVGLRMMNASKKDLQLLDRFITEEIKGLFTGFVKR